MPKKKIIYLIAGILCAILTVLFIYLVATGWGSVALVIGPFVFSIAFLASAFSIQTIDQKKINNQKQLDKKKALIKKQKEEEYVSPFFRDDNKKG